MMQLTPVVKNLLIINVAVFVFGLIFQTHTIMGTESIAAKYLALYNYNAVDEYGQRLFYPYQLFTYMFVHAGFMHILFNMIGLIFAGPILENTWGSMRFLSFYTICGIGAGAFNLLIDLFLQHQAGFSHYQPFSSMIGASGAIYGIVTAFGIMYPNMEVMMMFIPIPIKAKYVVLGFAGLAFYSVYQSIYHPSMGDNVAHLAHLGGIVVAVVLLQFWKGLRH